MPATSKPDDALLQIYLCDLTHDTLLLSSDTIPINIGFMASFVEASLPGRCKISLFKYPSDAINAIRRNPPDILALSNYSWNSSLSEYVAGIGKSVCRSTVTVQGGSNFPIDEPQQTEFMRKRPNTDVFVELEGEGPFADFVTTILRLRAEGQTDVLKPLGGMLPAGCLSINAFTEWSHLKTQPRPRIMDLDSIPSPYLSGMLDHFFDGKLAPFLETNRGCPFSCNFCHTGNSYFNKVYRFDTSRICAEIDYIGHHMQRTGITHLYLADTNFGMYREDAEISNALAAAQARYGWPMHIYATTGKNKKEHVIEATRVLGASLTVHMSVQSMNDVVLANVSRSNIRLDAYAGINASVKQRGQITRGEVILGLPGETRESFAAGIEKLVNSGIDLLTSYTLILLHGTEYQNPAYRQQFGLVGKFRLVPQNFGSYDGERIFDVEEVSISNNDLSFEDYMDCRVLSFMVEVLHNSGPARELFRYVAEWGIAPFSLIVRAQRDLGHAPTAVREVVDGFIKETQDELWDSEQSLIAHYSKDANFEALLSGEVGGNVINKYKASALVEHGGAWIDHLEQCSRALLAETGWDAAAALSETALLADFCKLRLSGLLSSNQSAVPELSLTSPVDILAWESGATGSIFRDLDPNERLYKFGFEEDQIAVQTDMLRRYGSDLTGLSKIMTRVSSIDSLFRRITEAEAH